MSNVFTITADQTRFIFPDPENRVFDVKECRWLEIECNSFVHEGIPSALLKRLTDMKPKNLTITMSMFVPDMAMEIVSMLDLSETVLIVLPCYSDDQTKEQIFWPSLINFVVTKAKKLERIFGYFEATQALTLATLGYDVLGTIYMNDHGRDHIKFLLEALPKEINLIELKMDEVSQKDYEALKEIKTSIKMSWTRDVRGFWSLFLEN